MSERPVECSNCKKPIKITYKEIVGELTITTEMCADCPVLQQKLQGPMENLKEQITEGLCCGHCQTTLESAKTGNPLGCSECYSVFSDFLVTELTARDKIFPKQKAKTLHAGKSPGKASSFTPSNKLTSLNEALNEALKRENYEQAAWLRDQIKALTKKSDEKQQ